MERIWHCWSATRCAIVVVVLGMPVAPAAGVIIDAPGDLNEPPSDDPGFHHLADTGHTSMVYLGNSWVLTAGHVFPNPPTTLSFLGTSYGSIHGTDIRVPNPPGMGLTTNTDLRMFRIDGVPPLPELVISSTPPPVNSDLTMIGRGNAREEELTKWEVDMVSNDLWIWQETNGFGNFRGYKIQKDDNTRDTRWGTNRLANEDPIVGESDPDLTTVVEVNGREVISLLTLFDQSGTIFEAQGVQGDSGGAVFYKRGNNWELTGIINATLTFPNQGSRAVFGSATTFADLSTYRSIILDIMSDPNYSIVGDINLDGVVNGDGTGSIESDDLSAFMGGWLSVHNEANVESWKLGDLNQDAITDLHDFRILRSVHPNADSLAAALGIAASEIPEPSSAGLAICAAVSLWWFLRKRRRS